MDNMYYDGTKLLSIMDINGNKPEIYICTTNRSAGKTTYFSRLLVNRFLKRKEKFCLIYRFKYELDDISNKFFKDIQGIFFADYTMESKPLARGIFHELFLNGVSCGYAVALNSSDTLKKYSHFFSDVSHMMMDEFQSETNHYCNMEVEKLISLHTSIARGNGSMSRYVPVYLIGNPVSLLNPYYSALGISVRIQSDTKFIRGEGWVMEQGYNENAAKAQSESAFNRAFSGNSFLSYTTQGVYLNDSTTFIEKPSGYSKYLGTIRYKEKDYAIREYRNDGIIYCDDSPDTTCKNKLAVTTPDHNINYVMLSANSLFVEQLRYFFERGAFRFKNLECKNVIIKMLSF